MAEDLTAQNLLWCYLETHCSLRLGEQRVNLSRPAPDKLPAKLVYVITAENPGSEPTDARTNRERNRELEQSLERLNVRTWKAVGRAGQPPWREDGFAVSGPDRETMVGLGARFGQRAIFEIDHGEVRVIGCLAAEQGAVLACRPRDAELPWQPVDLTEDDLRDRFADAYERGVNRVLIGTDLWRGRVAIESASCVWECGDREVTLDSYDLADFQQDLASIDEAEGDYPGGDVGTVLVALGNGALRTYGLFSWSWGDTESYGDFDSDEAAIAAFRSDG